MEIDLDIKTAAKWFSGLDDEQQADFIIQVAEEAKQWTGGMGHWTYQFWLVGRHLRDCSCSTYEARDLVEQIADGLKPDTASQAA